LLAGSPPTVGRIPFPSTTTGRQFFAPVPVLTGWPAIRDQIDVACAGKRASLLTAQQRYHAHQSRVASELGLGDVMVRHLTDSPGGKSTPRVLEDLSRQSVYSRMAGCEILVKSARVVFQEKAMPKLIASATSIACVGNVKKFADEFVGLVNTGEAGVSITRVKSPSGWVGVEQYSDYHEYCLVLAGLLQVDHSDGTFDVRAGQCLDIEPGAWVRCSTPGPDGADYVAVCSPAFSRARVHRGE
jgi:mannose-6-phosphate isomerase-like protein (cupin superfamily)